MTNKPNYSDLMFGYTIDQAIAEGLLFDPGARLANKDVYISTDFLYELNKEEIASALLKVFTLFLCTDSVSIVEIEVNGKPVWLLESLYEMVVTLPDSYYEAICEQVV